MMFAKAFDIFTIFCAFLLVLGYVLVSCNAYADDFQRRLNSCSPFKKEIQSWLESEGVSKNFYYLAACESSCRPDAVSKKGAVGIFQLMPWTSKHYRCDNAVDMECNTRAAARYLKHLYEYSPDFTTVVMMFNMGGHNLIRNGTTKESRGLAYCVNHMISVDKSKELNDGE